MKEDEDLVITVDSLDDPIDTTQDDRQTQRQEPPVRIKVPGREERAAPVTTRKGPTDDAVEDLKGQLTAAQQATRDAQSRERAATEAARTATAQVEQARTTIADTRTTALDSEIASATSESNSLKTALKAAMEAGDYDKASDIQIQIADARARLRDAEKDKARLAQEEPITRTHEGAVRQQERQPERRQETLEDRRQNILAGCTPATRQWLENHPDCLDDPEKAAEAALAHQRAIKAKLTPDTPAYFRFAEEQLGYTTVSTRTRQADDAAREQPARTNGTRRNVVESAPVDRGGGGGGDDGGGGGEQVTLTRGEADNATNGTIVWNTGPNKGKPIGHKEMARRKILLQKEGRYAAPASQ